MLSAVCLKLLFGRLKITSHHIIILIHTLMMKASAWICLAMILLICLPLAESTSKYRVSRTTKDLNSVALTLTYFGTDDFYFKETSPIVK